ncbi:hypothetical protein VEx25_0704 [Vibrio antiquarius]|uniref:Uncharacterized protein n=1 Tax=Vibrio antiquarius (strain Ex25) TaxID=150340 RepID=A0ABM9WV45_VIBAE|nr:hypothetical protein VEx25_0704 [Vibrio antiquarius]
MKYAFVQKAKQTKTWQQVKLRSLRQVLKSSTAVTFCL